MEGLWWDRWGEFIGEKSLAFRANSFLKCVFETLALTSGSSMRREVGLILVRNIFNFFIVQM